MTVTLRSSPSGRDFALDAALSDWGLQTAWVIDPVNGADDNPGTAAFPIRTMAEFNARLSGNYLQVAATVSLLGDVVDAPMQLVGTRLKLGASLSVSGTRTQVGAGQIATVTPLGHGGTTYPFQLTTAGFDWTTANAGAQIVLPGGQVCFVRNVVGPNDVVVGAMTTLSSATLFTPTAGLAFVVNSLSRAQPPILNLIAQTAGANADLRSNFQNLSFDGQFNLLNAGAGVTFIGCVFAGPLVESQTSSNTNFRSCKFRVQFNGAVSFNTIRGLGTVNCTAVAIVTEGGVSSLSFAGGFNNVMNSCSFYATQLFVANGALLSVGAGGLDFEAVTTGSILNIITGGFVSCSGSGAIVNGRNCVGASQGIDIAAGGFVWNGAANKPTLGVASGAGNDVRLGVGATALGFTYATLGTGKQYASLDTVPPSTSQIQLGGYAYCGQQG